MQRRDSKTFQSTRDILCKLIGFCCSSPASFDAEICRVYYERTLCRRLADRKENRRFCIANARCIVRHSLRSSAMLSICGMGFTLDYTLRRIYHRINCTNIFEARANAAHTFHHSATQLNVSLNILCFTIYLLKSFDRAHKCHKAISMELKVEVSENDSCVVSRLVCTAHAIDGIRHFEFENCPILRLILDRELVAAEKFHLLLNK